MKKILLSILIIGIVAAIAIGGTAAFFSEASNNVTASVTAADYKLVAGGPGWSSSIFDVTGILPGETWTGDAYVQNQGTEGIYITPFWNPAWQTGDNGDLDAALAKIAPVMIDGASEYSAGIYYLAAGATAHFTFAMMMKETGVAQNDLQGATLHYEGGFYGASNPANVTAYTKGAL